MHSLVGLMHRFSEVVSLRTKTYIGSYKITSWTDGCGITFAEESVNKAEPLSVEAIGGDQFRLG